MILPSLPGAHLPLALAIWNGLDSSTSKACLYGLYLLRAMYSYDYLLYVTRRKMICAELTLAHIPPRIPAALKVVKNPHVELCSTLKLQGLKNHNLSMFAFAPCSCASRIRTRLPSDAPDIVSLVNPDSHSLKVELRTISCRWIAVIKCGFDRRRTELRQTAF